MSDEKTNLFLPDLIIDGMKSDLKDLARVINELDNLSKDQKEALKVGFVPILRGCYEKSEEEIRGYIKDNSGAIFELLLKQTALKVGLATFLLKANNGEFPEDIKA